MNLVFKKKFNIKSTKKFSKISGDKNKIHLNKDLHNYSNFEKPIVQGCLVLSEIYLFLRQAGILKNLEFISELNVVFKVPIFIDEEIYISVIRIKNKIQIEIYGEILSKMSLIFHVKRLAIVNRNYNKILKKRNNNFILHLMKISKIIGNYKSNTNIITTINSKFLDSVKNNYSIKKYFRNLFRLDLKFKSFETYANFISNETKLKDLNIKLKKKNSKQLIYDRQSKILVIGGTAGLGKILTNYLITKKFNVTFTYNNNLSVAKQLYKKNIIRNSKISFFKFNEKIINNKKVKKLLSSFSYIYFFATPKIFSKNKNFFDKRKLDKFNNIYINFLNKIILSLNDFGKKYKIYVPSSEIVSSNSYGSLEYKMSKILLENYCKKINISTKRIRVYNPRLGVHYTRTTQYLVNNNFSFDKFLYQALNILKK